MSVIVELEVPAGEFEWGRVFLALPSATSIELDNVDLEDENENRDGKATDVDDLL